MFLTKIFGSRNGRILKQYRRTVAQINALERTYEQLDDSQLKAKTPEFKQRFQDGETLESLLPEAFAVCREASRRVLKMRHFDAQLIGGMALHYGKIAEMRTGEGKTLVATLPCYLNALTGKGVHVVTVNDYLAARDSAWMGRLHEWLGLSVGVNLSHKSRDEKQAAFAADITYGTNNEFGFDYLRDNMVYHLGERVMRGLNFAIVDEVDSILIDEARTPLIISGHAEGQSDLYKKMNAIPALLTKQVGEIAPDGSGQVEIEGDYLLDEKAHQVHLTERGFENAEKILTRLGLLAEGSSLYDASNINLIHHLYAALRAHILYHRDQHYVVQTGQVVIVDEFTGRLMDGRRWSEGLHQAVEAKEGVDIQNENQTLASITFQNYFRMYGKLSGMTGTADTEAYEFQEIYNLETVVIPPNRVSARRDMQDQVYKSAPEKFAAVIRDIKTCQEHGQPVLVGTTSIENSEFLSSLLSKEKLPHNVLNAKQHMREAEIIAQAGRVGAITIATNMAGRGTDIVLGGNIEKQIEQVYENDKIALTEKDAMVEKLNREWAAQHDAVLAAGGLHIIATERHESRRIDNQLRGRSGRQGDPGSSRFYLSLEDSLLRIFAGDRIKNIMERLKMPEGEPIESGLVSRSLESAQRKVEARNFDIRKQLLEYDDVANDQRRVIYQQRNDILEGEDVAEVIHALRQSVFEDLVGRFVPAQSMPEQWDIAGLDAELKTEWHLELDLVSLAETDDCDGEDILEHVLTKTQESYDEKIARVDEEEFHQFERGVLLQHLDNGWREHLAALDHLRQGIHLRGYAQKNPKQEYKREAFELFGQLLDRVKYDVTRVITTVRVQTAAEVESAQQALAQQQRLAQINFQHADYAGQSAEEALAPAGETGAQEKAQPMRNHEPKVGRNDPCPCGSGKKYKQCHGALI